MAKKKLHRLSRKEVEDAANFLQNHSWDATRKKYKVSADWLKSRFDEWGIEYRKGAIKRVNNSFKPNANYTVETLNAGKMLKQKWG